MGTQLPLEQRAHPPPPSFWPVYCGQTAGWLKTPLGTEVDLGPGNIVLDGVPGLHETGTAAPHPFGPCLLWPRSPISATAELLLKFGNISRSYRQEGCFTCSVPQGTVLHKDKEFAIDFTYDIKKLLLTVVTLVSPLILTLVVTNINLIRPIF